jgi:sugar lactone lactonase YvrE
MVPIVAGSIAVDATNHLWSVSTQGVKRLAPDGTVLGTYDVGGPAVGATVDSATGTVWIGLRKPNTWECDLARLSPQGVLLSRTPMTGYDGRPPVIDRAGNAWLALWSSSLFATTRISQDGQTVDHHAANVLPVGLAFDAAGNQWVASNQPTVNNVLKRSASGAKLGVNTIDGELKDIVSTPNGDIWGLTDTKLFRLTP